MPKGIYKHKPFSEEHIKRISESHKGKKHSKETKLKMSLARKGFVVSDKTKEKLREINIGKKNTKETLLKMSEAHKGNKNHFYGKHHTETTKNKISESNKGKISWMKGKYHTEKAKQKNRESSLGKHHTEESKRKISEANKGANNKNWNGGIENIKDKRNAIEYREWRLMVFGRDDYTCHDCGKRGVYLEAHHIKSWKEHPELRFEINNGMTLCRSCHIKKHKEIRRLKKVVLKGVRLSA
jgi:hypothetical protein